MNSTVTATITSGEYHLNESIEIFYEVSKWLNVVMITLVAIFGLYGNIVSIIIFANPSYNKNSINSLRVYLILLATSDLLVLVCYFIVRFYCLYSIIICFIWDLLYYGICFLLGIKHKNFKLEFLWFIYPRKNS